MKNRLSQNKGVLVLLLVVLLGLMGMGEVFSSRFFRNLFEKISERVERGEQFVSKVIEEPASGSVCGWYCKDWLRKKGTPLGVRKALYEFDILIEPYSDEIDNPEKYQPDEDIKEEFGTTKEDTVRLRENFDKLLAQDKDLKGIFAEFKSLIEKIKLKMGARGKIDTGDLSISADGNRKKSLRLATKKLKAYIKKKHPGKSFNDLSPKQKTKYVKKFNNEHDKIIYNLVSRLLAREQIMRAILISMAMEITEGAYLAHFEKPLNILVQKELIPDELEERYKVVAAILETDIADYTGFLNTIEKQDKDLEFSKIKSIDDFKTDETDRRESPAIFKDFMEDRDFSYRSLVYQEIKQVAQRFNELKSLKDQKQRKEKINEYKTKIFEYTKPRKVLGFIPKGLKNKTDYEKWESKWKGKLKKLSKKTNSLKFDEKLEEANVAFEQLYNETKQLFQDARLSLLGQEKEISEKKVEKASEKKKELEKEESEEEVVMEEEKEIEPEEEEKAETATKVEIRKQVETTLKKVEERKEVLEGLAKKIEVMTEKEKERAEIQKQVSGTIEEVEKREERAQLKEELVSLKKQAKELSAKVDEEVAAVEVVLARLEESKENWKFLDEKKKSLKKSRDALLEVVKYDNETTNSGMSEKIEEASEWSTEVTTKLNELTKNREDALKQIPEEITKI